MIAAAVLAPASASADVTVTGIGSTSTGAVSVYLFDPSVLWVRVEVLDPVTQDVLATTDNLHYEQPGGWTSDRPVRLPAGAPYGQYPVTVDYRPENGAVQHWSGTTAGNEFAYVRHCLNTIAFIGVADIGDFAATPFGRAWCWVSAAIWFSLGSGELFRK